ncbi:unnamed protein product, partial [Symbiodinium microadriaticum]
MTQPLVEQTWEVWLVLRLAALGASVLGSSWLLRATCKQPTVYLFNCQLRHLALADLCLSLVDPGYELAVWAIWPVGAGLPPLFNICCRGLFHALLCVVCFVEAQIAAGVMGSALHSQRCFSLLAKLLVFAWPAAAAVGAVDAVAMHLHTEGQRAFGFTKVLEVVLFTNFLLTLLMYLTSLVAVLRTPSPSAVVRRASLRALAYPCGFLITAFPDWLLYIRVIPENVWSGRLASLAMYSNGWVNAAVYGCQNRPGSRLTTPGLALQGRRGSSPSSPLPLLPSFHVGFRVGDSRSFLQTVSSEDPCAEARGDPALQASRHGRPFLPTEGGDWSCKGARHGGLCGGHPVRVQDAVVGIPVLDGFHDSGRTDQLGDQPRGRVAAENGSWLLPSSGPNRQCHSSAMLWRRPPGHGRTVLLHIIIGGRRRAAAL